MTPIAAPSGPVAVSPAAATAGANLAEVPVAAEPTDATPAANESDVEIDADAETAAKPAAETEPKATSDDRAARPRIRLGRRSRGVGAYLGGSANETDVSARVSAHVAIACNADVLIAKPGQGVDEALMLLGNEMRRALALMGAP